jgi:para-aminobenzoate synthetase component I
MTNRCTPTFYSLPYGPHCLTTEFSPLMSQPWTLFLHSGSAEHPHSRFDILVADPQATCVTYGEITTMTSKQYGKQVAYEDPLTLLQQLQQQLLPTLSPHAVYPFQGGAVGLLSYDLGRRFEKLPTMAAVDTQLPDMAFGLYDWALIADHQQQQCVLICQGDCSQRLQWLQQQRHATQSQPFQLTGAWVADMSRSAYAEKFFKIQTHLQRGDCYQVNLAQRFCAPYQGDEWQAFQQLQASNLAPFSAFLRFPEATLLSFSPERFLQVSQGEINTRPIKGTCRRYADPEQDHQAALTLAASSKDRAENLMIVDLLRNDIGRVARPGSVQVTELFLIESFPAVHHLVSTITATLDPSYTLFDLLRATFPGGSVTGAPKIAAMKIIEALEPQRRSAYCGSIGYISCCGTLDMNITIRTLLAEKNRLYCWAGGAIVADSDMEAEYQETFDKLNKILPLLAPSQTPLIPT